MSEKKIKPSIRGKWAEFCVLPLDVHWYIYFPYHSAIENGRNMSNIIYHRILLRPETKAGLKQNIFILQEKYFSFWDCEKFQWPLLVPWNTMYSWGLRSTVITLHVLFYLAFICTSHTVSSLWFVSMKILFLFYTPFQQVGFSTFFSPYTSVFCLATK